MTSKIKALAASTPRGTLEPFEYSPGPLGAQQIEIAVEYCGICHSDLSMLDNEWGMTQYPFVPGHEVAGRVAAVGSAVKTHTVGQRVGLGWFAGSCMSCPQCMDGDHNMCGTAEQTIVARHGGFANRVRCNAEWAIALPETINSAKAGPLFCGGITVFNPLLQLGIRPTDRVGVIGIGGLGHMALAFLNKWGCEVYAFTSSDSKRDEALQLGAHKVVNSRNSADLEKIAGKLDAIISTVAVTLNWDAYIATLAPRGRLHFVGVPDAPVSFQAFPIIGGGKSLSGTPLGSPRNTALMLDFCSRHHIEPVTEEYPMSRANEAIEHLRAGNARYRIVLKNDLG